MYAERLFTRKPCIHKGEKKEEKVTASSEFDDFLFCGADVSGPCFLELVSRPPVALLIRKVSSLPSLSFWKYLIVQKMNSGLIAVCTNCMLFIYVPNHQREYDHKEVLPHILSPGPKVEIKINIEKKKSHRYHFRTFTGTISSASSSPSSRVPRTENQLLCPFLGDIGSTLCLTIFTVVLL